MRYHRIRDGATIFDMVRPLTLDQALDRADRLGIPAEREQDQPLFRCVRWDEATRRCTRYSERPEMCRDYPYEGECDHAPVCRYREPLVTRFVWTAIRCGCKAGTWLGRPFAFDVTALTLPG